MLVWVDIRLIPSLGPLSGMLGGIPEPERLLLPL